MIRHTIKPHGITNTEYRFESDTELSDLIQIVNLIRFADVTQAL